MHPEIPKNYTGEDVHEDFTKSLSKIWDNVIPESFPEILKFETESAIWVEHKKLLGPYSLWEEKMYVVVDLLLSSKPFYDHGWDGKRTITQKDFNEVYNNDFFNKLRERMYELAKYVGVRVNNFTLLDKFKINVQID